MDSAEHRIPAAATVPETPTIIPGAGLKPVILDNARRAAETPFSLPSYLDRFKGEPETIQFLGNLLEVNFNHLDQFLSGDSASDRQIASRFGNDLADLMNRVVAEEFQTVQSYDPPPELGLNHTLISDKVLMLKRSAFIYDMKKKKDCYNEKTGMFASPPSFIFLDLKDLYSANMAGSADWMLSKVAQKINETARAYMTRINKTDNHSTCRYGGDEFVVGTVELTPEENRELQQLLIKQIGEIDGYYMDPATGKIQARSIEVNEEKSPVLTIPSHPVDREIFTTYMDRGLLLDHEQVEKVRAMYSDTDGGFDYVKFRQISAKNDRMRTDGEKVASILFGDPDLANVMTLTDYMDRRELELARAQAVAQGPKAQAALVYRTAEPEAAPAEYRDGQNKTPEKQQLGRRKHNMVNLLEGVVYDALLGDNVVSFESLQSQMQNGAITKMACVDLKFIKEINDASSYAEGDMAIEALWKTLAVRLTPIERRSLVIARRGGTFILGQRKKHGDVLADRWLETFLDDMEVQVKGERVRVPLGVRYTDLPEGNMERAEAGQLMGQLLQRTESSWYGKIADSIKQDEKLKAVFDTLHGYREDPGTAAQAITLTASSLSQEMRNATSANGLIVSFFFGKPGLRTDMRVERIMQELYPPKQDALVRDSTVQ